MSLDLETGRAYDANAFAADVDEALDEVCRTVNRLLLNANAKDVAQPTLRRDMTTDQVLLAICLSLVMRQVLTDGFIERLSSVLVKTKAMLLAKNAAYGDSALNPVRIFSTASLKEQLLVRLDDKASRLMRGSNAGEDVAADMLGYFVLVLIADKRDRAEKQA